jgi:hypothetical protein
MYNIIQFYVKDSIEEEFNQANYCMLAISLSGFYLGTNPSSPTKANSKSSQSDPGSSTQVKIC